MTQLKILWLSAHTSARTTTPCSHDAALGSTWVGGPGDLAHPFTLCLETEAAAAEPSVPSAVCARWSNSRTSSTCSTSWKHCATTSPTWWRHWWAANNHDPTAKVFLAPGPEKSVCKQDTPPTTGFNLNTCSLFYWIILPLFLCLSNPTDFSFLQGNLNSNPSPLTLFCFLPAP